jgi:hypothetical protein
MPTEHGSNSGARRWGLAVHVSIQNSTSCRQSGRRKPVVRHEAPPVHHAARRRGGGVATRGARAAGERVRRIGILVVGSRPGLRHWSKSCSALAIVRRIGRRY